MPQNKQIMIDEIDVSGCRNIELTPPPAKCKLNDWIYCEGQNCCFKQLALKTQECEELNGRLKYIREENKYLKESATDEQIDFVALNNHIKALEFQIDKLKASKEQAEQKLERIKEIAENRSNYPCGKCIKGKILQIIDEVE